MLSKIPIRIVAIVMLASGLLGLYNQFEWVTNESYRLTINALGPPNAVEENWAITAVSVLLVVIGFAVLLLSSKHKGASK